MNAGFGWIPKAHEVRLESRRDGSLLIQPVEALGDYPQRVTDRLEYWAAQAPQRMFIAQADASGYWQSLSYGEALQRVRRIAASLALRQRHQRLSPDRPLIILSRNSIEHLLLGLAAMYVGVPYVPVSTAYVLQQSDPAKLRHIFTLLTPGMVVVFEGASVAQDLAPLLAPDVELVSDVAYLAGRTTTSLAQLESPVDELAYVDAHAAVGPDTIAKFLLTSGSIGNPKAVITTQRMLCSNQIMLLQAVPFVSDEPPVVLDWLPWSHTFGGSHNVNLVLFNGGSLYIDNGRPVAGDFEITVRNIKDISPTIYFNVPKGFELLVLRLQEDAELSTAFFRRLRTCFSAGAGLSQHVWDALNEMAVRVRGTDLPMISGLGATECAPTVTCTTPGTRLAGLIGLPLVGNSLKLVPIDGKLEIRVKGPNVTPGYWRQPELTCAAFDAEGYYCLGDAAGLVDAQDISKGLFFDGRIAENFKLSTGTWVSVGPLREALVTALEPLAQDVVIAGMNQEHLAILIFPFWPACAALAGVAAETPREQLAAHPAVRAAIRQGLQRHAGQFPGSSTLVKAALLLTDPPSPALGEITDKGSISQRTVLRTRADSVARLYAGPADTGVLRL